MTCCAGDRSAVGLIILCMSIRILQVGLYIWEGLKGKGKKKKNHQGRIVLLLPRNWDAARHRCPTTSDVPLRLAGRVCRGGGGGVSLLATGMAAAEVAILVAPPIYKKNHVTE
jgi:hypothetical protein